MRKAELDTHESIGTLSQARLGGHLQNRYGDRTVTEESRMSTSYARGCHPDRPCRHGPTPAVIYLLPSEERQQAAQESCENYLRLRGWPHLGTVLESTPDLPLWEREGWKEVMTAKPEVVLVHSLIQAKMTAEEFAVMRNELINQEIVLVSYIPIPT